MRELLKTVPARDFRKSKNLGKFELMSKTGTTSDTKDSWIAGGTPYYVCAVWLGYDKPKVIPFRYSASGRVYIERSTVSTRTCPSRSSPRPARSRRRTTARRPDFSLRPRARRLQRDIIRSPQCPPSVPHAADPSARSSAESARRSAILSIPSFRQARVRTIKLNLRRKNI